MSLFLLNLPRVIRKLPWASSGGTPIAKSTFANIAQEIASTSHRRVRLGSYADYSMSLHIYGQDFGAVTGDESRGLSGFFDAFPTEEAFIDRSLSSEMAAEMLVLPQLRNLLSEQQIEQWQFPPASIQLIERLIDKIEFGDLIV